MKHLSEMYKIKRRKLTEKLPPSFVLLERDNGFPFYYTLASASCCPNFISANQRSASMADIHPVPAAVIA